MKIVVRYFFGPQDNRNRWISIPNVLVFDTDFVPDWSCGHVIRVSSLMLVQLFQDELSTPRKFQARFIRRRPGVPVPYISNEQVEDAVRSIVAKELELEDKSLEK